MRLPIAAVAGEQLEREILTATGIAARVVYYPPGEVEVIGEGLDEAEVAAIVAAHVPQESERRRARRLVATALAAMVGLRFQDLTAQQRQLLVMAALYKFGALDGDGRVKPLEEWL